MNDNEKDPLSPPADSREAGSVGTDDNEPMPVPLLLRLRQMWGGANDPGLRNSAGYRWFRRAIALGVLAILIAIGTQGIAHVGETQVGVQVNNLTGDLELAERVGYHLFFPYSSRFYLLDKTIQRLDLNWRQGAPGMAGRDLKLKTADGSNVSLDVIINFKLIPEKATEVLRHSGPGMRFAETWLEPFARQVCFSAFGQLNTEEMYDANKRNEKAQTALKELNERLAPHGIEVVSVIPGEFRFYREYEQVIQDKKLADQKVEEQQAQARAALQDQARELVEANKKAETRLASFEGECANRMIQAEADANKVRREADGKYAATLLSADAALHSDKNRAEGEKATLFAQAEGMEQMRRAMGGDGGVSMIGLEYARHLASIRFSGTPIARDPSVHQFAVESSAATAVAAPAQRSPSPGPAPGGSPPGFPMRSAPNSGVPTIPGVSEGPTR